MIQLKIANELGYESKTVTAVRVGWFAIHRQAYVESFSPLFWVVTHIPSGRAVGWFWQIRSAKGFADWLNTMPFGWGSENVASEISETKRQEIVWCRNAENMPRSVLLCH